MAKASLVCHSCGAAAEILDRVGRKDECDSCAADLHVCKNCSHYDTSSYNECRETSADRVVDKEHANFCDFFAPGGGSGESSASRDDMMAAAEALFKKG